jgi:DNA-binding transcriptional regulator GbsR (MarR family)
MAFAGLHNGTSALIWKEGDGTLILKYRHLANSEAAEAMQLSKQSMSIWVSSLAKLRKTGFLHTSKSNV